MITKTKVFFRTDGNSQIGLGHIFRSLALADLLKPYFESIFFIQNPVESIKERIKAVGELIELPATNNLNQEAQFLVDNHLSGNEIVVLDGYHFRTAYQEIIKTKPVQLVCIDDIYAYRFCADAIINHAGGIQAQIYTKKPTTCCYLGLDYALLQAPFLVAAREKNYNKQEANTLFICLGGADPKNDTLKVLQSIASKNSTLKIFLVLGASYQHQDTLDKYLKNSSLDVTKLSNLSATEMVEYMQRSSAAICPPSTISYEYLSVGGCLYLYTIADNQHQIFDFFVKQEIAFDFNNYPVSEVKINKALKLQEAWFDGKSQQKLQKIFLQLSRTLLVKSRLAEEKDLMLYFNWANDRKTRENAFNTAPIPLEGHSKWFSKKIKESFSRLYLFEVNQKPIGQVRLEKTTKNPEIALISFSVDTQYHGLGYGIILLKLAIEQAIEENFCSAFDALVKVDNLPSLKVFERLNFEYNPDTIVEGVPCKSFTLNC